MVTTNDAFTMEIAESGGWATVKHFGKPIFDIAFSYMDMQNEAKDLAEAILTLASQSLEADKFGLRKA